MLELIITWDTMQEVVARDSMKLYYVQFPQGTDPETYQYRLYCTNKFYLYNTLLNDEEEVEDFETNHKAGGISVGGKDDALALVAPAMNTSFVQQVELVPRVGHAGSAQWTICSPNWARRTTWYQHSDQRTDISCTPDGSYIEYTTGYTNWINPDDYTVSSQSYNKGAAGGFGFNNLWLNDGTRGSKTAFRPVIKKNGTTQTSGYTFNYATGVITFGSALENTDTVTISGRTSVSSGGSSFVVRPVAGKKLIIPHVELNISEDIVMNSPAVFEIWAGDPTYSFENGPVPPPLDSYGLTATDLYCQYRMEYDSMHQIVGLSTGKVTKMPVFGGTDAVDPSASNGWSTNQKRGFSVPHYEIIFDFGTPSEFGQPIVLPSSVYAQMRVYLGGDVPFGGEYSSVTFYAEEANE